MRNVEKKLSENLTIVGYNFHITKFFFHSFRIFLRTRQVIELNIYSISYSWSPHILFIEQPSYLCHFIIPLSKVINVNDQHQHYVYAAINFLLAHIELYNSNDTNSIKKNINVSH